MKSLSILLLFITVFSCATSKNKIQKSNDTSDIKAITTSCENGDGMACSKLAYFHKENGDISKAVDFNKKGCELKEQSACFNLKGFEVKSKYELTVLSKVKFYTQQIDICYKKRPYPPHKSRLGKRKTMLLYKLDFTINNDGIPRNLSIRIQTDDKNEFFDKCAVSIFNSARFTPPSKGDRINYSFTNSLHIED